MKRLQKLSKVQMHGALKQRKNNENDKKLCKKLDNVLNNLLKL